jgi:hypothetical protein
MSDELNSIIADYFPAENDIRRSLVGRLLVEVEARVRAKLGPLLAERDAALKDNEVLREVFDINARAFGRINQQQIEMVQLRRDIDTLRAENARLLAASTYNYDAAEQERAAKAETQAAWESLALRQAEELAALDRARDAYRTTSEIERQYSLLDRRRTVEMVIHAIDYIRNSDHKFIDKVNAVSILCDGIENAIDGRATGEEWRTVRHGYRPNRDGAQPPVPKDRRCQECGGINTSGFSYCYSHRRAGMLLAATPQPTAQVPEISSDSALLDALIDAATGQDVEFSPVDCRIPAGRWRLCVGNLFYVGASPRDAIRVMREGR